ncbi:MAG TPA: hypothetical protein ENF60_01680 [Candidatus Omnitrophica bacterium]|nr:hypothetical protein [Candidatus Omnitrophota bacterium]
MQNSENYLEEVKDYFLRRFGIPESFWIEHTIFFRKDKGWIINPVILNLDVAFEDKISSLGFPFVRKLGKSLKPTSWGLIYLGHRITRNIVNLNLGDLKEILLRGRIIYNQELTPGYVALNYDGNVVGCGFYQNSIVEVQIPKARRKSLLEIIMRLK